MKNRRPTDHKPDSGSAIDPAPEARDTETEIPATVDTDPLGSILADLINGDAQKQSAARQVVSVIASGGRPWEQMPQKLRTAARFDAESVLEGGGGRQALLDAGYDGFTAGRLLQDLGQA